MSETRESDRNWECDWQGHERAQLRRWARLPLWEKLDWLEEAQQLAEQLQSRVRKPVETEAGPKLARSASPAAPGQRTS